MFKWFLASTLLALSITPSALAGGVGNRTTTRHGKVNSSLRIDSARLEHGREIYHEQNAKIESFAPGFAFSELQLKNGVFTGRTYGSNDPTNPDPVSLGSFNKTYRDTSFLSETNSYFEETFRGFENITEIEAYSF